MNLHYKCEILGFGKRDISLILLMRIMYSHVTNSLTYAQQ